MKGLLITCIYIGILHFCSLSVLHAQGGRDLSYQDQVQIISNYSDINSQRHEVKTVKALLNEGVEGFRIHLLWDYGTSMLLYKTPQGKLEDFSLVIDDFKVYFEQNPNNVLTLFLDLDLPIDSLIKVLKQKDVIKHFYTHTQGEEWPTIQEMIKNDQRLVLFSMESIFNKPDWLHYIWDYAVEPYFSLFDAPNFMGEFLKGDPKNQLLIFNDFNFPSHRLEKESVYIFDVNTNHYLMTHCLTIWRNTGKIPNFVFMDLYDPRIQFIQFGLNSLNMIKGTVTYNMQLMNSVGWEGRSNCQTNGKFNFPIVPGDRITLAPKVPGFRFMPESVYFEEPRESITQNFVAVPLNITTGLMAYYPFDGKTRDESLNNFHGKPEGIKFTEDKERDYVAVFDGDDYVVLPTAEDMHLRDHDFTISAWIKIYPNENTDNSIIGNTVSSYQEGLHFTIRNKKPYFGFYSNDVQGNTKIEDNEWYHVVCRYNKLNGEQAIFVNGKLDSKSFGHPPYQGKEELIVGNASLSWPAFFVGEIDDLTIWDRTLGDEEIYNISKDVLTLKPKSAFLSGIRLWSIVVFSSTLIIIVVLYIRKKRLITIASPKKKKIISAVHNEAGKKAFMKILENGEKPKKNVIKLFGIFYVLDKEGKDITSEFTPKLKNLFLVILLHSSHNKNGITTEDLTKIVWPNYSNKSAKNSRGVNIRKLRVILNNLEGIEIIFSRDRWTVELSDEVYCDYFDCLNLLDNPQFNSPEYYLKLYYLVRDGQLVKNENYEWMDDIKGYIDYRVIDILLKYIGLIDEQQNSELILDIIDRIHISDPVNEKAFEMKIKMLLDQDNFNTARYAFDAFTKNYQEFYGQAYKKKFDELVSTNNLH